METKKEVNIAINLDTLHKLSIEKKEAKIIKVSNKKEMMIDWKPELQTAIGALIGFSFFIVMFALLSYSSHESINHMFMSITKMVFFLTTGMLCLKGGGEGSLGTCLVGIPLSGIFYLLHLYY